MNFNDARIARVYVTETNGTVQDDTPNAPVPPGAPAANFDVHLEMEAGGGVAGSYVLIFTAYDVTDGAREPTLDPPVGPLRGPGNFAQAPWVVSGRNWVFTQRATIAVPAAGVQDHVFRYTVALRSGNFQIVDTKESDLFILV